ncbi:hypothetical protein ILUMI_14200, partial [Ignelater luminosus]
MPRKRKQLLIMYDISTKLTETELAETVYYQNLEGQMTIEEFKKQFALSYPNPLRKAKGHNS